MKRTGSWLCSSLEPLVSLKPTVLVSVDNQLGFRVWGLANKQQWAQGHHSCRIQAFALIHFRSDSAEVCTGS